MKVSAGLWLWIYFHESFIVVFCQTVSKISLNISSICMVGRIKVLLNILLTLGFTSFNFIHAKWINFMTIFIKTFNEIWQSSTKDFFIQTFSLSQILFPSSIGWTKSPAMHKIHSYLVIIKRMLKEIAEIAEYFPFRNNKHVWIWQNYVIFS